MACQGWKGRLVGCPCSRVCRSLRPSLRCSEDSRWCRAREGHSPPRTIGGLEPLRYVSARLERQRRSSTVAPGVPQCSFRSRRYRDAAFGCDRAHHAGDTGHVDVSACPTARNPSAYHHPCPQRTNSPRQQGTSQARQCVPEIPPHSLESSACISVEVRETSFSKSSVHKSVTSGPRMSNSPQASIISDLDGGGQGPGFHHGAWEICQT